jgi:phosphoglycerate dehydrogenase-like enzyme
MTNIVVGTAVGQRQVLDALASLENLSIKVATEVVEFRAALADAHVAVITGTAEAYSPHVALTVRESRTLRWIHLMSTGYEGITQNGLPESCLLTRPGEGVGASVAEHAFALLLALSRRLPEAFLRQSTGEWDREFSREAVTLAGKTLLVVGFGAIGRKVGAFGKAVGMHVIGLARSTRTDECAHEVHPISSLHGFLPRADAIVVALPLTDETAVLFDRRAFQLCRLGALFVNVGRGGTVDQDALMSALRERTLRGAALDVMTPEPLPAAHPLWSAPRLLLTPHIGGAGDPGALRRMAGELAENIKRFQRGEPLQNLVLDRHASIECREGRQESCAL